MIDLRMGDCLDIMPTLPAQSIDAIITDLPYGITACKWDVVIPFEQMWIQLKRLSKLNAAIVLFGSQPFTSTLISSNINMYRHSWVWDKGVSGDFQLANIRPLSYTEDIVVFGLHRVNYYPQKTIKDKPIDKRNWKYDKSISKIDIAHFHSLVDTTNKLYTHSYPTNIIRFSAVGGECNKPKRIHPTQKPVVLMEYLIRTYTNEGDMVLDFCMGSGTTGVACAKLNRNFIGCEIDPKYYEIAKRRIEAAMPIAVDLPLFSGVAR